MHVMMCFNMDIDLDPSPTEICHNTDQPCMDIDLVVQVNSPTHRRAVDLPGTYSLVKTRCY